MTNVVIATVPLGSSPQGIAVDPVRHLVYVVKGDGTMSVIDGVTQSVVATVAVGSMPRAVALDPVTRLVYVALEGEGAVVFVDAATNTVVDKVLLGPSIPAGIVVDPATHKAYVSDQEKVWVIR
jgi:YVTN family beta-propeller protein